MLTAEVRSAYSTGPCVSRSEDPKSVLTSRGTPQSHGALSALQSAGIRSELFALWKSKVGHRVLTAHTWACASYVRTLAPFSNGAKSPQSTPG